MPHKHAHVLADWHKAGAKEVRAGDRCSGRGPARLGELAVGGSRGGVSPRRRAADHDVAADAECGDDARPVEDGVSGGDRRGVASSMDFWRFNVAFAQELYRRAADQLARRVEPVRLSRARRVRLRGDAVQLHRHRRQPADGARADGLHGRLEAGVERDAERALHHEAARGGGPAARRHQLRARRCGGDVERACSITATSPACTSPDRPACSTASGSESGRTSASTAPIRGSSARPAARTSSSSIRPPIRRRWRSALVRGAFEYQGQKCSAASRAYLPKSLWPDDQGAHGRDDRARSRWATCATSATSWAR